VTRGRPAAMAGQADDGHACSAGPMGGAAGAQIMDPSGLGA